LTSKLPSMKWYEMIWNGIGSMARQHLWQKFFLWFTPCVRPGWLNGQSRLTLNSRTREPDSQNRESKSLRKSKFRLRILCHFLVFHRNES
jgi:hypothetical protein